MSIEERLRETLDTFTTRVRRDLDGHLDGLLADLTGLLQESEEGSRAESDRAVNDARVEAERAVQNVRAEGERAMKDVRMEGERAVDANRQEAERAFTARLEGLRADMARDLEARLSSDRAELEAGMTAAKLEMREHHVDTFGRLVGTFRRLEEVTSLSGILEALAQGAAVDASRVAVLVVDNDMLRNWGCFGFAPGEGPSDMPLADAGPLQRAVSSKGTSMVSNATDGGNPASPAFMRVPAGHIGMVVPIVVGGEVVALLYADGAYRRPDEPDEEDAPTWTEEVQLLARHAALRLENVTSVRTVQVLTRPV